MMQGWEKEGRDSFLRLIEYMDVGNRNGWRMEQVVPSRELLEKIKAVWPLRAVGQNYAGEVARRYEFVDGAGEIWHYWEADASDKRVGTKAAMPCDFSRRHDEHVSLCRLLSCSKTGNWYHEKTSRLS